MSSVIRARFRTHEAAFRVFRLLERHVNVELGGPDLDGNGSGYPWVLTIVIATSAQQALVIGTVGRHGGVTFQEGDIE